LLWERRKYKETRFGYGGGGDTAVIPGRKEPEWGWSVAMMGEGKGKFCEGRGEL